MAKSTQDSVVRSSKEIKASLLREAWMTGAAAEIISQIMFHHKRSEMMPEGHKEALYHIVAGQDPALMRTNLRNYLNGYPCSFSSAESTPEPASGPYLEPKVYETHKIFAELQEEERQQAQSPDFFLENGGLINAESIGEVLETGRVFYADDVCLANFRAANSGELNYAVRANVHEPYTDDAYQAKNSCDDLSNTFAKAAVTSYSDDAFLQLHPENTDTELALGGKTNVHEPYRDDRYEGLESGDDLYAEIMGTQPGAEYIAIASNDQPTQLDHPKTQQAHSPYIDAFFNATRWGKSDDIEARKKSEAMDSQATIKPRLILQ